MDAELVAPPGAAASVFGAELDRAVAYAEILATEGTVRGLIGPREVPRLWDRHLLNSAVVAELVPPGARVVDAGSGAGLPGIPLALARPDLAVTLLEPLARRHDFLVECLTRLGLDSVRVVRGRAEEGPVRRSLAGADVVTARAVAPLDRLAGWCLPLLRPGGRLLAVKGDTADAELTAARPALSRAGAADAEVVRCGAGIVDPPTTVVVVTRSTVRSSAGGRQRGGRVR
ncbi:MAG TPA: 16S rRNA (guanine(527)-N(7))-methyltransferase RsmG [Actinoplanes sp.]|nr:16S rRNA (guanine(527)-N(7))-methyltransferase RsmG [Actinoplanes sp.]